MSSQDFEQQVIFYHKVFVYCAIAALIFLLIAIILFFVLKIPRVFGEMTGRDARKAIDEMMAENATSGSLTSMKLGEDGRRRRRGKTGALSTGKLRKNTAVRSGGLGRNSVSGKLVKNSVSENTPSDAVRQGNIVEPIKKPVKPAEPIRPAGPVKTQDVRDDFGNTPTDVLDSFGSEPTDVLRNYGSAPASVQDSYSNAPVNAQNADHYAASSGTDIGASGRDMIYQEPFTETMVLNQSMKQEEDVFVILRSIVEVHTDEVI